MVKIVVKGKRTIGTRRKITSIREKTGTAKKIDKVVIRSGNTRYELK